MDLASIFNEHAIIRESKRWKLETATSASAKCPSRQFTIDLIGYVGKLDAVAATVR